VVTYLWGGGGGGSRGLKRVGLSTASKEKNFLETGTNSVGWGGRVGGKNDGPSA